MKKLSDFCLRVIAGIGTVLFLFLAFYSVRYTARMYTENEDLTVIRNAEWKNFFFLIVVLFCAWMFSKARFLTQKVVHILAVIVSVFLVGALFLLVKDAHVYAISNDQLHVYLAAVKMVSGDFFEYHQGEYFGVYPFQLGLAFIYSLFYRLVGGEAPEVVQYVHAVCVGITVYAGFRITRELFHSVAAECVYLLASLLFVPMYLYTLFMYGETISVCGTVLAILFWTISNRSTQLFVEGQIETGVKLKKYVCWICCAVALSISYIARPSVIIVWIAMFIIQVLIFFKNKKVVPLIMILVVLLIPLAGQKAILSSIENKTGVQFEYAMPNELLVAMGLQGDVAAGEVPGQYNAYTWSTFSECGFDREISSEVGRDYILGRVKEWIENPGQMILFFKTKLLNQWNEPSFGVFTVTRFMNEPKRWVTNLYYGDTYEMLYNTLDRLQSTVYILVLIYFVYLLIGKVSKNAEGERICVIQPANYLPGLVIIGGILFSAIWEAKSRYVYPYMVIAMPYMAGVAALLAEWIRKLLSGVVIKYNLKLHVESFSKNIKNDLKKYIQERSLVDWLNIIILGIFVIAHGCLMYFLFYRQAIHYDEKYYTDISPYIFHMQGIDTGYDFPYPVMFWVGKFFWNFMNPERAMATAVTVLNSLSVIFLKHYVDKYVKKIWKWNYVTVFLSTLLTFTMLYVSMLFMDLSEGSIDYRYRGVFSPNPFHNATFLATRPFSIVCFFLMVELLDIYEEKVDKKKYIVFAIFCLLTTMTKPSFALGFVITAAFILLYRMIRTKFTNLRMTLYIVICAVPSLIALLYQYKGVFTGKNAVGEETGIGFGWLVAWGTMGQPILPAIILGLAFPILVLLLHWKEIKQNTGYRLSLQYLLVNFIMVTCLYEKGFRVAHVNFAWGYMHAMSFFFIMSALVLLKSTIRKKQNIILLVAQWALYLWHLVCGIVYFISLLGGSGYL